MKIYKYSSVRLAVIAILVQSFLYIGMSYSLSYLVTDTLPVLYRNILIILCIYGLHSLSMYLGMKAKALAEFYVTMDLKQKVDKGMLDMGYGVFNEKDHGEHLSRYVNDVPQIIKLVLNTTFEMVENGFLIFWIALALFKVHYSILLLAFVSLGLMVFIPQLFQKRLSKYVEGVQKEKEKYLSKMREFLHGYTTFLENSVLHKFLEKSRKASYKYALYGYKSDSFAAIMSAVLTLVNSITTILALGLLSYFVIQGKVNAGTYLVVVTLFPQFGNSVMTFLTNRAYVKSGQDFYTNTFSNFSKDEYIESAFLKGITKKDRVLSLPNLVENKPQWIESIQVKNGAISFEDKRITYPERLVFERGRKYAIMGESGCGKSTLAKILLGQVVSYDGEVEVNGKNFRGNTLFDGASYVSQQTFLFNDTIRNNIDMNSSRTDDEVRELLHAMKLNDFDLDHIIKDNGKNLSGGQRQRIAIARAFARKHPFLILDEATANLDKETTKTIEEYVLKNTETLIMITHHLSERMRERMDHIIVLK